MNSTAEVQSLQHQLDLARRACRMIYDQPTLDRLEQLTTALHPKTCGGAVGGR